MRCNPRAPFRLWLVWSQSHGSWRSAATKRRPFLGEVGGACDTVHNGACRPWLKRSVAGDSWRSSSRSVRSEVDGTGCRHPRGQILPARSLLRAPCRSGSCRTAESQRRPTCAVGDTTRSSGCSGAARAVRGPSSAPRRRPVRFPRAWVHSAAAAALRSGLRQWRKWRIPVNSIARPASSAAAMTSSSRIDPPG